VAAKIRIFQDKKGVLIIFLQKNHSLDQQKTRNQAIKQAFTT
jgi:hypothetical protein